MIDLFSDTQAGHMKLIGVDNLRDVIAFPKTQRGQDLLMAAPSVVETTLV